MHERVTVELAAEKSLGKRSKRLLFLHSHLAYEL